MTQQQRPGLTGPLALAIGGCMTAAPLLMFFYLLFDGRMSYPNTGVFMGMLLFVMFIMFAGLFTAAIGLQLILGDSSRRS